MFRNSISLLVFLLVTLNACSDISLKGLQQESPNAQSKGDFCTYDPIDTLGYTNYLFIVDRSGSNEQHSDKQGLRLKKIKEFYEKHKGEAFVRWGAIRFGSNAKASIKDDQGPIFSDDIAITDAGIEDLTSDNGDMGSTNYGGTLDMAKSAIQRDIETYRRDDNYIVMFITDGQPNVAPTDKNTLVNKTKDLVGLRPGKIFFSAAYYGGQGSPDTLEAMARAGNGKFIKDIKADQISFEELADVGIRRESWILKKDTFFVYNMNSAVCESSRNNFDVDSDGDGVCDADEIKYGLDPTKSSTLMRNSKNELVDTGYSDLFHVFVAQGLLKVEQLPKCPLEKRIDEDFDLLNNCEEAFIRLPREEGDIRPQAANPKDPDTDNDGIIDGLELRLFREDLSYALDEEVSKPKDSELDLSAFRQAQLHKNPLEEDSSPTYDTVLTPIGVENGRSCFDYNQSKLAMYGNVYDVKNENVNPLLTRAIAKNVVLIYFIQTKFLNPKSKGIYMYSFQELETDPNFLNAHGPLGGLKVKSSVFTPYETYKKLEE